MAPRTGGPEQPISSTEEATTDPTPPPGPAGAGEARSLPCDVAIAVVLGPSTPGTPVPPFDELVARTGLAPIDVAAGLEILVDRHALEVVPGAGRLVTRRIPYRVDTGVAPSLTGGVEQSGSLRPGMQWRSLVRSVDEQPAPPDVAEALGLTRYSKVVRVSRDRLLGDEVVGVGISWLRPGVVDDVVGALFEHGSLAGVVAGDRGRALRRLRFTADLRHPPPEIAAGFGRAAQERAWFVESVNAVLDWTPLELSRGWLRADRFRLILGDAHPA